MCLIKINNCFSINSLRRKCENVCLENMLKKINVFVLINEDLFSGDK